MRAPRGRGGATASAARSPSGPASAPRPRGAGARRSSVSSVVVLPAPLGPISATTSPGSTERSSSRTAARSPYPADKPVRRQQRARSAPRRRLAATGRSTHRDSIDRLDSGTVLDDGLGGGDLGLGGRRRLAEVGRDDRGIAADLVGGPGREVPAGVEDADPVADAENQLHVVLDHEHGHPPLACRAGRPAGRARRSRRRRARRPVRRATGPTVRPRRRARSRRDAGGRTAARRAGGRGRPRARTRASPLARADRGAASTGPDEVRRVGAERRGGRSPVCRFSRTVMLSKSSRLWNERPSPARLRARADRRASDRPSRRIVPVARCEAGDRVDQGRLAGAVGADQTDDLAGCDRQGHAVERDDAAVAHAERPRPRASPAARPGSRPRRTPRSVGVGSGCARGGRAPRRSVGTGVSTAKLLQVDVEARDAVGVERSSTTSTTREDELHGRVVVEEVDDRLEEDREEPTRRGRGADHRTRGRSRRRRPRRRRRRGSTGRSRTSGRNTAIGWRKTDQEAADGRDTRRRARTRTASRRTPRCRATRRRVRSTAPR